MRQIRLKLLDYSLRRVGAVVGMVLLLTLGPILMANFATKEDLAYFLIGVQINRMFFSLFGPIGIVLLPKFAYEVSKGMTEGVNRGLSMIFQASTAIGLFAMVHLFYFAKPILENWLGEATPDGVLIFRFFALSIPFYLLFENARNPIDAYSKKGYNSRNLLISLGVLLMTLLGLVSLGKVTLSLALTWSYVVGYSVLGLLSLLTCWHLYRFKWSGLRTVFQILFINAIILSIIWMAIRYLGLSTESIWHLAIIEIVAFSIYILCIFQLKQSWLSYLLYQIGIGKPTFEVSEANKS
jgi:O-antigen/teichoic acid export membrane protein